MKYKYINKKNITKIILILYILFFAFFCTSNYLNSPLSNVYPWVDSSAFLYDGNAILNGLTMYTDFFDHKGPLMFIINALGLKLGGIVGVWVFDFLAIFIFFYFMYKTFKLFTNEFVYFLSSGVIALTLPFYLNIGNYVETYSLAFIGISLYLLVKYFYKEKAIGKIDSLIIGFSCMACLLLRPNVATIWLTLCPIIFFNMIYNKKYKNAINFVLYFILGFIVMFLPFAIYFSIKHVWTDFIYQYVLLNFVYIGNDRMTSSITECLKYFIDTPITLFVIFSFISLIIKKTTSLIKNKYLYICTLVTYLLVTIYCVIMSGRIFTHYAIILSPICFLLIGHLINILYENIKYNKKEIYINFSITCILAIFALLLLYENNSINYYKNNSYIWQSQEDRAELINIKKYIDSNTSKDDKIIVSGFSPEIYLYSNRLANTKYFYQNYDFFYTQENMRNEFLSDVESNDTKLFISNEEYQNLYPSFNDQINKILNDFYICDFEYGVYKIYKRKELY